MSGSTTYPTPDLSIYDTAKLVHVVNNLKTPTQFLLDQFFPTTMLSDTEQIVIDVDVGKRRMAPFVSPLVEGKIIESRTVQSNLFTPAYIKDKRAPDFMRPVRRMIGERIAGTLSPQERMEANIIFEMQDQIEMVDRRLEWMAAQALATATLTVAGDDYPPVVINCMRDPALTIYLNGEARWGQANISPALYLQMWSPLVLQKSGAAPNKIVFTNTPWLAFKSDINVFNAIYADRSGESEIEFGGKVQKGGVYMGRWGQFDLYVYNEWYVDPVTDIEYPMLPDGMILMGSDALEGIRAFVTIKDPTFNYGALAYAPKMWRENEPAQLYMMMQSAPLVIPSRVNAVLAATVMSPGAAVYPLSI